MVSCFDFKYKLYICIYNFLNLICHHASFLSPLASPPLRNPFSVEGVGADVSSPYSSNTSADTDLCSGYCTSTRTFRSMRAPSFSPVVGRPVRLPGLRPVLPPKLLPPPTVIVASRPMLVDASTKRVLLTFLRCVPSRRPRWRLPHLGYIGDDESMSKILDNQGS
jgi:hypothetical protein